jgi:hypothetical protein
MRRKTHIALLTVACACTCPALHAQTGQANEQHSTRDSVAAWSIGAGYGLVVVPVAGLGYPGYGSGFVSLEPRIAPSWVLHAEIGAGYEVQWVDAPDARRYRFGRVGLGIRHFFVSEGRVRPSALIQGVGHLARQHTEYGDFEYEQVGGEIAVAIDGSISEPVAIRLEAGLLSGGYAWIHEGESDFYAGSLHAGLSPRFELRLAW